MEIGSSGKFNLPLLYHQKGITFWLQGNQEAKAEACISQAIMAAQAQQAKPRELQATISLCRLWHSQGKREAAHTRLRQIYAWFTEGFVAPDLIEACALLEELSTA